MFDFLQNVTCVTKPGIGIIYVLVRNFGAFEVHVFPKRGGPLAPLDHWPLFYQWGGVFKKTMAVMYCYFFMLRCIVTTITVISDDVCLIMVHIEVKRDGLGL